MNKNMRQLLKLLLGAGLLLVEPGRREKAVGNIRDRVDDWSDTAKEKYEDAVDRLERASYAIRGRERWSSKLGNFLLGMGIGVGVGMLFAPAAGEETRNAIAEQASNIRDRVSEQASNIREKVRESVTREGASGGPERMPRPAGRKGFRAQPASGIALKTGRVSPGKRSFCVAVVLSAAEAFPGDSFLCGFYSLILQRVGSHHRCPDVRGCKPTFQEQSRINRIRPWDAVTSVP